jgi:hypothetical protein
MNINGQKVITNCLLPRLLNGCTAHAAIAPDGYMTRLQPTHDDAKQSNAGLLYKTIFKIKSKAIPVTGRGGL